MGRKEAAREAAALAILEEAHRRDWEARQTRLNVTYNEHLQRNSLIHDHRAHSIIQLGEMFGEKGMAGARLKHFRWMDSHVDLATMRTTHVGRGYYNHVYVPHDYDFDQRVDTPRKPSLSITDRGFRVRLIVAYDLGDELSGRWELWVDTSRDFCPFHKNDLLIEIPFTGGIRQIHQTLKDLISYCEKFSKLLDKIKYEARVANVRQQILDDLE